MVEGLVAVGNQILNNSKVNDLTFDAVHVAVDESYDETSDASTEVVLDHITSPTDGFLDNAHSLRDEFSADLVAGIIGIYAPPGYLVGAGVAWTPRIFPARSYGFSVTGGNHPFVSVV